MGQNFRAVIISLAGSLERRAFITRHLHDWEISWEFLDAATSDSPSSYAVSSARQRKRFGRLLSPAEIGCFKSHLLAMGEFQSDRHLEWLLVVEDDVCLDTSFPYKALTKYLNHKKICYLRLYAKRWKVATLLDTWQDRQLLRFRTDPYGAQAYLINRAGAERFMQSFSSIDMPIDDELGRFWINLLPPYAIFPFPAFERSTLSNISFERNIALRVRSGGWSFLVQRISDKFRKTLENLVLKQRELR